MNRPALDENRWHGVSFWSVLEEEKSRTNANHPRGLEHHSDWSHGVRLFLLRQRSLLDDIEASGEKRGCRLLVGGPVRHGQCKCFHFVFVDTIGVDAVYLPETPKQLRTQQVCCHRRSRDSLQVK